MINFGERTWEGAMRHAHAAIVASERLYEEINAPGVLSPLTQGKISTARSFNDAPGLNATVPVRSSRR